MHSFERALEKKLSKSRYNRFGADNYDEYRFGEFPKVNFANPDKVFLIKRAIKKIFGYKKRQFLYTYKEFLGKYQDGLQSLYERINLNEQKLLIDIISFRLLGYEKVRLARNNKEYWDTLKIVDTLIENNDSYDPHFLHFILQKFDLRKIGYDITLYFSKLGIAIDFIFEQYAYTSGDNTIVAVEKGEVVLDLGACWGDTALYFATKTGKQGKVYSFEFIPDNIKIFNLNISLNPKLKNQIELIQLPVSNNSETKIYFNDKGPGSRIQFEPFDGQTGTAITISIDDFVKKNRIASIDFIKMDIEGAETLALEGAIETISRFKPKLAIAIYHSMDDFVNIPKWVMELDLGYKLFIGHYTIHSEETILYASVQK